MSVYTLPRDLTSFNTKRSLTSTPPRAGCENTSYTSDQSPAQMLKCLAAHASTRKGRVSPGSSSPSARKGYSERSRQPLGALNLSTPAPILRSILKHGPSSKLATSVSWSETTYEPPSINTRRPKTRPSPKKQDIIYETARQPYPLRAAPPAPIVAPAPPPTFEYAARYLAGFVPGPSLPRTGCRVMDPAQLVRSDSGSSLSDSSILDRSTSGDGLSVQLALSVSGSSLEKEKLADKEEKVEDSTGGSMVQADQVLEKTSGD